VSRREGRRSRTGDQKEIKEIKEKAAHSESLKEIKEIKEKAAHSESLKEIKGVREIEERVNATFNQQSEIHNQKFQ
jgi:hypothetical protein